MRLHRGCVHQEELGNMSPCPSCAPHVAGLTAAPYASALSAIAAVETYEQRIARRIEDLAHRVGKKPEALRATVEEFALRSTRSVEGVLDLLESLK